MYGFREIWAKLMKNSEKIMKKYKIQKKESIYLQKLCGSVDE